MDCRRGPLAGAPVAAFLASPGPLPHSLTAAASSLRSLAAQRRLPSRRAAPPQRRTPPSPPLAPAAAPSCLLGGGDDGPRRSVFTEPPPPEATVAATSAAASRVLEAWLVDNGVYLSDKSSWGRAPHPLAIANETTDDGEPSGRGLIAVKGVVQGEPLFKLPLTVLLTKERALKTFGEAAMPADTDDFIAIAALLIRERSLGDDSFFSPYLGVLPRDEELTPLFRWSEEELAPLAGSPTVAAAASLRRKVAGEYADADAPDGLFGRTRSVFDPAVYTEAAWEWAFAVLFSRLVLLRGSGTLALVPYADLLNHNPYCGAYIDTFQENFTGIGYVCVFTDRPYGKMEQVYTTYGQKTNSELLLLYGFVVDRNPYDAVDVSVTVDEGDPMYARKVEFLDSAGQEAGTSVAFPLYADRYPMELIEYLRFCVATEGEMDSGADWGDFVCERNEVAVAQALLGACTAALTGYQRTLEEDDALVRDRGLYGMLSSKQRAALRQVRGEKRILQRTIANTQREMQTPRMLFTSLNT